MKKSYIRALLPDYDRPAQKAAGEAFCPSNIALVKYWGKRAGELNLPLVSSLSLGLGDRGTRTRISLSDADRMTINGTPLSADDPVFVKAMAFLGFFRAPGEFYAVVTENNIPTAAGVASSASGFAALLAAADDLKGWGLALRKKSMLARLGSGSATRSFWPGAVLWHRGARDDGMDCYAEPVALPAGGIGMAVLLLDTGRKAVSSRDAMEASLATSPLARDWPARQQAHLDTVLRTPDFFTLGAAVEENAVLLHDLLARSVPPIVFSLPETEAWKERTRVLRAGGLPVFFTQDAGPNLKLVFPAAARAGVARELDRAGVDYFIV